MAGGIIHYPPELPEEAQKIAQEALTIHQTMEGLRKDHVLLQQVSVGANAEAFATMTDAYNKSGLANVEKFQLVAQALKDGHIDMMEWDMIQSRRWG